VSSSPVAIPTVHEIPRVIVRGGFAGGGSWTRTLGPREGLRFSRPSSLAAIGPVPRMYASRAAFGSAARRLAECAERVPADARIAVLVGSDDTRTPPFVSEAIGLRVLSGRGIAGAVERGQSRKSLSVPRSRLKSSPEWGRRQIGTPRRCVPAGRSVTSGLIGENPLEASPELPLGRLFMERENMSRRLSSQVRPNNGAPQLVRPITERGSTHAVRARSSWKGDRIDELR
jgi:hypothetical protein